MWKCPNCETVNNTEKCIVCGQEMPKYSANAQQRVCVNCGAKLETGMDFCGECGTSQKKPNVNYVFCGNCGEKIPDTLQVCTNCGEPLYRDNKEFRAKDSSKKHGILIIVLIVIILAMASMIFGYILYDNSTDNKNNIENTQASVPSESSETNTASEIDNTGSDANIERWDTYYVVNCNTNISLKEAPDISATSLAEIHLGDPVSYVEPAKNGFAKVIYNGMTGYALQSYLSNNPADIKSDSSTAVSGGSNTGSSTANGQKTSGVVSHPAYNTYTDSVYKFKCSYPVHFVEITNNDQFVRCSYKAPDNTATLNICGTNNSSNLSAKTVQDNFKSSYPGTIDYENSGNDWCVCRTYKDGIYHYGYFKVKDGMIRGFELHFDGDNYTVYDGYVNDIYNDLNFD